MKLSFTTLGCPAWSLDQIIRQATALGFDGVDLRGVAGEHIGPNETAAARADIRRRFEAASIEIPCIMGYSMFTDDDPQKRRESIETAKKFIQTARDIGCPRLRVFGGAHSKAGRDESLRRLIDGLRQLAPHAERSGVTVVLETHDDWCKAADIGAVMQALQLPAVGVCWDIANSFFVESLEQTFPAIKDYIRHVHFKDAARSADGRILSTLPGTGQVPMERALRLLKEAGYDEYLSFEWEKKWEPEIAEPEIAFPHYIKHVTAMMARVGAARGSSGAKQK